QRIGVRALDADKDGEEICLAHQRQQRVVVGEVDRSLGREAEGIAVRLLPADQVWQESLHGLLVADEVVVDEIDPAAMPEPIQGIELGEHLSRGLDPGYPAVELDDVAELAGERTPPRELNADVDIVAALQQVE